MRKGQEASARLPLPPIQRKIGQMASHTNEFQCGHLFQFTMVEITPATSPKMKSASKWAPGFEGAMRTQSHPPMIEATAKMALPIHRTKAGAVFPLTYWPGKKCANTGSLMRTI